MIPPSSDTGILPDNPLQALRRFARPRKKQEEACEFCSVSLGPVHRHLLEVSTRKISCACDPCALLFQNSVGGRWKLIPRDARRLLSFQLSDMQWDSLALPINLAFLYFSSTASKPVALYPSPAGAIESLLPLTSWQELVQENPELTKLAADVEALLVNRVEGAREYYVAPMDSCFELVGLIRTKWQGLSGGPAVWEAVKGFFDNLREQAVEVAGPLPKPAHA